MTELYGEGRMCPPPPPFMCVLSKDPMWNRVDVDPQTALI